ncbi:hypothetical protein GCM10008967_20470 [Bacillus carboniphilus]|uniref:Amidohydrolase-related domain-containing protein n=1 Tax=Bacillus carboniphilus TaxID=86663 RepID=A0ABP3FZ67_9BACI
MCDRFIIRGKRLVTVSELGTIEDGAMVIEDHLIRDIGPWASLKQKYLELPVVDYSDMVITPSLVDCHTHLLEFAPSSLYPVTQETHFQAAQSILFTALSSGITALGEQICGHPLCDFSLEDYKISSSDFPIDISFATTSISIGFEDLAHFSSVTKSQKLKKKDLVDPLVVKNLAMESEYPGENIFINATPANFSVTEVPRAGEIIYSLQELQQIVSIYHEVNKEIGAHVAGEEGIALALEAEIDVLHHSHGITDIQLQKVAQQKTKIVATPMGGTHIKPNSPEEILKMMQLNIPVSIATDAYLPPYPNVPWLHFTDQHLKGPETLMLVAKPAMELLHQNGYNDNQCLALITNNPSNILGKGNLFGRLEHGLQANFLVATGLPGLEITDPEQIKHVYFHGQKVIERKS